MKDSSFKYTATSVAGIGRVGSFIMPKGHAVCDVALGITLIGNIFFGILASPIASDFIE